MSTKNIVLILAVVAVISFLVFYPTFTIAQSPILRVRAAHIETNASLTGVNISVWNSTSLIGYNETGYLEIHDFNLYTTEDFYIVFNDSKGWYYNLTDDNGTNGYNPLTDDLFVTVEMYPKGKGSFTVYLKDEVSGRPAPDVVVKVFSEGSPGEISQSSNYRCNSTTGICKTDENGNIMLIIPQNEEPNPDGSGHYLFRVIDDDDNYQDKNETTVYDGPWAGNNGNVDILVKGVQHIWGYITDTYNPDMKIADANITLWDHDDATKYFGWYDTYFYNGTTDAQGFYQIWMPSNLLVAGNKYDVRVEADNYTAIYSNGPYNNGQGWENGRRIDFTLTGPDNVTGTVIDATNGQPVEGATVTISNQTEGYSYALTTNPNGYFTIRIKESNGYNLNIVASGYRDNASTKTGAQNLGNMTLRGRAHVTGQIVDEYQDDTGSDIPLVADVDFSGTYSTTSDASGDFGIYVRSGSSYSISISKVGYYINTFSYNVIDTGQDEEAPLDTIRIAGKHMIYGTVTDSEPGAEFPYISNAGVVVYDSFETYKVTTDGFGNYSVNISSIGTNQYHVEIDKNGYKTRILNNSELNYYSPPGSRPLSAQLVGVTKVSGYVADAYSRSGNPVFIPSATMYFMYSSSKQLRYTTATDSGGYFDMDLGIIGNYDIYAEKSGYNSTTIFDKSGSSIYDPGYLNLTGTAHVYGVITDAFSDDFGDGYIEGAYVTIYEKNSSEIRYRQTVTDGSYDLWIDGDMYYEIEGNADGYPRYRDPVGYNGNLNKDITLTATFQTFLTDKENTPIVHGIQNARVQLYHYYDTGSLDSTTDPAVALLNETTLNVSVICGGNSTLDNITVTLEKTDYCYSWQSNSALGDDICHREQNTTGGYTLFQILATGTYDVTVDGSQVGCAVFIDNLTVTSAAAGQLIELKPIATLDETTLEVKVIDPIWFVTGGSLGNLDRANVNISTETRGPYTSKTPDNDGDGVYTFHFARSGTNNVSANDTYHYLNYTYYNVTPGDTNDFTSSPLILQPHPANLSVHVINSTGKTIPEIVSVSLMNQTSPLVDANFLYDHYSIGGSFVGSGVVRLYTLLRDASSAEYGSFVNNHYIQYSGTMDYFNVTVKNLDVVDRMFSMYVNDDYGISSGWLSPGEEKILDTVLLGTPFNMPGYQKINISVIETEIVNDTHAMHDASTMADIGFTYYENEVRSGSIETFNITIHNQEGYGVEMNFSLDVNGYSIVTDQSVGDDQNITFVIVEDYPSVQFNPLPGNQVIDFAVINRKNVTKTKVIYDASGIEDNGFTYGETIPKSGTIESFNITVQNKEGYGIDFDFDLMVNGVRFVSGQTVADGQNVTFDVTDYPLVPFSLPGQQDIEFDVVPDRVVVNTTTLIHRTLVADNGSNTSQYVPKNGIMKSFNVTVENRDGGEFRFNLDVNGENIVPDQPIADGQNVSFDATDGYGITFTIPGYQDINFTVLNRSINITDKLFHNTTLPPGSDDGIELNETIIRNGTMDWFNVTVHNWNGTTIYVNITVNSVQIADIAAIDDEKNITINATPSVSFDLSGNQTINVTIMNDSTGIFTHEANYTVYLNYSYISNEANYTLYFNYSYERDVANYTVFLNYSYERDVANYTAFVNYSYSSDKAFYTASLNYSYTTDSLGATAGWVNFSYVYPSVYWDVLVNGTQFGYNYTYMNDTLLEAGNETILDAMIRQNRLIVHVYGLSGGMSEVKDANVTLWTGDTFDSPYVTNGLGEILTALTNSTGYVVFNRTIPGTYNMSIEESGFDIILNMTVTLGINDTFIEPVMDDTVPPQFSNSGTRVWGDDESWHYNVNATQGRPYYIFTRWTDNTILRQALLQLRNETGYALNYSYMTLTDDEDWSNYTVGTAYINENTGENVSWRIRARDTTNNWNETVWTSFHINDTESPSVTVEHIPDHVVAGKEVVFRATVTDNHNITDVSIFLDYVEVSGSIFTATSDWSCDITEGGRKAVCSWKSSEGFALGENHYYYATASDEDGNTGRDPETELNVTTGYNLTSIRSHGGAVYAHTIYPELIYFIGGELSTGSPTDDILSFSVRNPAQPSPAPSIPVPLRAFGYAYDTDNDNIYLFGGYSGTAWSSSTFRFDIAAGIVTNVTSGTSWNVPSGQVNSLAAYYDSSNGEIYLFGGDDGTTGYSDNVEKYTVADGSHSSEANSLPIEVSKAAAVYADVTGNIYIIGGHNSSGDVDTIIEYELGVGAAVVANLPAALEGVSAAYHEDLQKIYIFGGYDLSGTVYSDKIYEFDPVTKSIRNMTATLPTPRAFTYAVFSDYDNKFYIAGGEDGSTYYNDIIKYDPVSGKSFTVTLSTVDLIVNVSDNYNAPAICTGGTNPSVKLNVSSLPNEQYYSSGYQMVDSEGLTTFSDIWPGVTYNIYISASGSGFEDYEDTVSVGTADSQENITIDMTEVTINLTTQAGEQATGAYYTLNFTGTDSDTIVTTCDGHEIRADSYDGVDEWKRVDLSGRVDPVDINLSIPSCGSLKDADAAVTVVSTKKIHNSSEDFPDEGDEGYEHHENIGGTTMQSFNVIVYNQNGTDIYFNITVNGDRVVENRQVADGENETIEVSGTFFDLPGDQEITINITDGSDQAAKANYTEYINYTNSTPMCPTYTNSQLIQGENLQMDVDPDPPGPNPSLGSAYPYYQDVIGDNNTVTVIVNGTNSTGQSIFLSYVNVSFIRDDRIVENTTLTNSIGRTTALVTDGVYNVSIDGRDSGYDYYLVENIKVGKLVFANGTTDSGGQLLLVVDGQPINTPLSPDVPYGQGYYAKIETAGYGSYDTLNEGIDIFSGTYDQAHRAGNNDVKDSFYLELYGLSMINGTVIDTYCDPGNDCTIPSATVNILDGLHRMGYDDEVRYFNQTDTNGYFAFRVSPYTADSYWNSPKNVTYDIQIDKTGYNNYYISSYSQPSGIKLKEYDNDTYDPELTGSSSVSGYVYGYNYEFQETPDIIENATIDFVVTATPPINDNIAPSTAYYNTITGVDGDFLMTINTYYTPYNISVDTDYGSFKSRSVGPYPEPKSGIIISLYGQGIGGMRFYVLDEEGEPIEDASINVDGPSSQWSGFSDSNGEAYITSIVAGIIYDVTINGTDLGYGVNQTEAPVVWGDETIVSVNIPATEINMSLYGSVLNDTIVYLKNSTGHTRSESLVNGSAVFSVLLLGEYNISFSDIYESRVYYLNGEPLKDNITGVTLIQADAGQTYGITYLLNQTRLLLNITNSTGYPLENVTVTISNISADTYTNDTNASGIVMFEKILPASNYTISFNQIQLNGMGFILPSGESVEVLGGENENTVNSLTITIQDIQVRFNITDKYTSSGVASAYVALTDENGTVINNTYGQWMNGITDANGEFVLHTVPEDTYYYYIDANSSGYGIWNNSQVTVTINEVKTVDKTLEPISLVVYVFDSAAGSVLENVNVTVLYGGAFATNASDAALSANVTGTPDYVNFTRLYLYPLNYTVNVTSPRYFGEAENVSFALMNPETLETLTFNLIERKITVNVENSTEETLEEAVSISIRDDTGVLTSLNGSSLSVSGVTDSADFTHLPDGIYSINVSSDLYFNTSRYFNVSNITLGIDTFYFTMIERTVYINLRDSDSQPLGNNVTVNLTTMGGGVVTGTDGNPIDPVVNTTELRINFSYIPDGNFFINVTSDYYFSQYDTVDTNDVGQGINNTFTFLMDERTFTVMVYDFADRSSLLDTQEVNITVYNSTDDIAKNTTGQDLLTNTTSGIVIFTGIIDDTYNISAEAENYTAKNETFDPASGQDTDVDIYMKKLNHGYFNVTVYKKGTTTPISGAAISLRYLNASGTEADSATTGSGGYALVEVNVTEYDQSEKNMTFVVSAGNYDTNSSVGYFNVSNQGVENVVVTLEASESPPPPPGGGGRATGGIGAVTSETQSFGTVYADTSKTVQFTLSGTLNVQEITVLTDEDASGASVTVKASSKPSGSPNVISALDGIVYKYLDISAVNLPDSVITSATITFKVPKSWITTNNINPDDVHMFRYSGVTWRKLETTYLSNDGTWYYYRTVSPGFSTFAIAGYYLKEKDMELTLYSTYLNANDCKTVYLTVKNTGGLTLTNVHVDKLEAEWGIITQSRGISSLGRGLQDRVTLRICADRDAEKGTYDYSLDVVSDQLTKTVSSQVQVTKTYLEVLTEQIDALEAELAQLEEGLDAEGRGYYDSAEERIDDSRQQLERENYDGAINSLGEANDYLEKIKELEPEKGYLDMFLEWIILNYILSTVIAAILIGMSSVVMFRRRITRGMPELPTGGEVLTGVVRVGEETIDNLMSIVRELETRVDKIDFENLGDNERKWYNKIKLQIENMKRSIDGGEFKKAERHANDAELYMKMLELHSA